NLFSHLSTRRSEKRSCATASSGIRPAARLIFLPSLGVCIFFCTGETGADEMITSPRLVQRIVEPQEVVEGAGVRLRRSIGTRTLDVLDPFLLLDHFASTDPSDYQRGFPMHPHRGIETVTYVLKGVICHRDTVGNSGTIGEGDVQWMTAAGGIMHEEMPQVRPEGIRGFQLWVNLPAALKMSRPRYQGVAADEIPEIEIAGGSRVKIIAG